MFTKFNFLSNKHKYLTKALMMIPYDATRLQSHIASNSPFFKLECTPVACENKAIT